VARIRARKSSFLRIDPAANADSTCCLCDEATRPAIAIRLGLPYSKWRRNSFLMKTAFINRQRVLRLFGVGFIATAIVISLREEPVSGNSPGIVAPIKPTRATGKGGGAPILEPRRDRPKRLRPELDMAAGSRLRSQLEAGELGAVHDELTSLAESKRLALVGDVLTQWCRAGSFELAQWAIVLSGKAIRS
jgi:hypothetical protein